jgi:hypothetical protein
MEDATSPRAGARPHSVTMAGGLLLGAGLWSGFLALTLTLATFFVWVPAYACGILCAAWATLMGILLLAGVKTGRALAISAAVAEIVTIVDCDIIGVTLGIVAIVFLNKPETVAYFAGAPIPDAPMARSRTRGEPLTRGTGLEVESSFIPLMFLLFFTHPVVTVGGKSYDIPWGRGFVPLEPGTHDVKIHFPYLITEGSPATAEVEVEPGRVTLIRYTVPVIVMMAGKIVTTGSEPAAATPAATYLESPLDER